MKTRRTEHARREQLRRLLWGIRELRRDFILGIAEETFNANETAVLASELENALDALQRAKTLLAQYKVKRLNKSILSGAYKGVAVKQNKDRF